MSLILLLSSKDRLIRLNQEILKQMERVLGLSCFLRSQLFLKEGGGGNNRSALIFSTHCQVQFSKREFIYFLNNIRTKKIIVLC